MSLANPNVKVSVENTANDSTGDIDRTSSQGSKKGSWKDNPRYAGQGVSLWLLWPRIWLLVQDPIDTKDNLNAPTNSWHGVAEARLIIELSSDSYHYAVSWIFDGSIDPSDPMELAVFNSLSCKLPLRVARSEVPIDSRASQERALSSTLVSHASIFPLLADYFRRRSLTTRSRLALQNAIPSSLKHLTEPYRERHLYRSLSRSKTIRGSLTRSVVVIAFHSWLPTKFVRTANLGSSGAATDLATMTASLVHLWLSQNIADYKADEHSIRIISLEGFGRMAQRTEALLLLLENWQTEIRNSDVLLLVVTSHSVGFGLEVMLLLVGEQGNGRYCRHRRVAFMSLGGATLGPVPGIDARVVRRAYTALEYDIISDMIDLARPTSESARRMDAAVKSLLARPSVRLIFCAAVDDLLIPLTSALATHYYHPRLIRFLYGKRCSDSSTPEFALLLLEMIVILKNLGWSDDFGVLQEISDRCVTADVNGAAASMVNDSCVFDEAIQIAMETTSLVCDCRHELAVRRVTSPLIPTLHDIPGDTPFTWRFRCLLESLTLVSNIHNAHLMRRIVKEYWSWLPSPSGARLFRDAHMLFGALADVCAEDLLV